MHALGRVKVVAWVGSALVGCLFVAGVVPGGQDDKKELPGIEKLEEQAFADVLDKTATDLSVEDLVELVLQLSEGQRSTTNAKLAAMQKKIADQQAAVLHAALRVAIERRDKAGFEKVAQAAQKLGHKELSTKIAATRSLVMKTRVAVAPLMVALDDLSPEALTEYKALVKQIEIAKLAGDKADLRRIEEVLPLVPDLNDAMREQLKKKIAEAAKEMPVEADPGVELLRQLSSTSRAASAGTVYIQTTPGGKETPIPPGQWVNVPPGAVLNGPVQAGQVAVTSSGTSFKAPPAQAKRVVAAMPGAYLMMSPNLPLALVVGGKRIQWGSNAGTMFATRVVRVDSAGYHRIPLAGEILKGAKVVGAPGRPGAFLARDGKTIFPVNSIDPISANGSTISSVTTAAFDRYTNGGSLFVNTVQ